MSYFFPLFYKCLGKWLNCFYNVKKILHFTNKGKYINCEQFLSWRVRTL